MVSSLKSLEISIYNEVITNLDIGVQVCLSLNQAIIESIRVPAKKLY